ncbi:hypothetical protein [Streptomyces sp. NPDC017941]|uniref:hypothetical protein n=1 Tax=Streptomyces sp. NPDC017941 TaxID=3365018 RepID=UPI00379BCE2C
MTDHTTDQPTAAESQRMAYMHLLSLAERIISTSSVLPTDFTVQVRPTAVDEPALRFYFHNDPDSVGVFAAEHGMNLLTEERGASLYTEARSAPVEGIAVTAWTLMANAEQAAEVTA